METLNRLAHIEANVGHWIGCQREQMRSQQIVKCVNRYMLLQLINEVDGLYAQHEPIIGDQLFDLILHCPLKPILVKDALAQGYQSVGSLLSNCENWIRQHTNDRRFQLLLHGVTIEELAQLGEEVDRCEPYAPCLVLGQIDQGWDQLFVQGAQREYADQRLQVLNQADDHLSAIVLQQDGHHGYQVARCLILAHSLSQLANTHCHAALHVLG